MVYLYILLVFVSLFSIYLLLSKTLEKTDNTILYILYKIALFLSVPAFPLLIMAPLGLFPDYVLARGFFLFLIGAVVYFLFIKDYLIVRKKLKYLIDDINVLFGICYKREVLWEEYRYCYGSKLSKMFYGYFCALTGTFYAPNLVLGEKTRKILMEKAKKEPFHFIYAFIALNCTKLNNFNFELFLYSEQHLIDKEEYDQKKILASLKETIYQSILYSRTVPFLTEDGSSNKGHLEEDACRTILSFLCQDYTKTMYRFPYLDGNNIKQFWCRIEESRDNTKKCVNERLVEHVDRIYDFYVESLKRNVYILSK